MSKASRILLIALLGLTVSLLLGATGVAPVAAVAPVAEAGPAVAPAAYAQAVAGSGAGSGSGSGSGSGAGAGLAYAFEGGSYMGVDTQDVTKERMTALKLKQESGVEVLMVDHDAPAGKAGLKEHDVILEFNGAKVESVEQLRRMIHEIPAGRTVTLGISRDGQPLTLNATLAERSQHYEFNYAMPKMKAPKVVIPKIEMPDMREFQFVVAGSGRAGLLVENLTPQLGEFFGVKDGAGVLVRSVEKGSPAEAAGFKAGDIIVRVEQDKIADRGDWRSTLRSHRSGKISVGIIRDKREQTLSLVIPEVKEQSSTWRVETPDMDELNDDLDEMNIEINQLGPQMERLKPEMERLKPEMERQMEKLRPQMEQMKRELSARLTASLTQGRDEMRKAMEQVRSDSTGAAQKAQAEATRAARQARLEAQRAAQAARRDAEHALQQQRKALDKARLLMQRPMEMD